ncbi:hypothetical protein VNO80_02531 [Phaseolus coccineus]|uniref:Uncharacterized protein n=1 Tax=Phaseolus coccineus TaxID=3886 RepID=A0AAN9NQG3_PHACN
MHDDKDELIDEDDDVEGPGEYEVGDASEDGGSCGLGFDDSEEDGNEDKDDEEGKMKASNNPTAIAIKTMSKGSTSGIAK